MKNKAREGDSGKPQHYQNPSFPENLYRHNCSFDEPEALPPVRQSWPLQQLPWQRIDDGVMRNDALSNTNQPGNTPPYRDPRTNPPGARN